ncbi:MAG: HD domain-containing protein [Oscillospiraceae bacterium]|nr:HD domain-containing protein [Oscillospiraceae bacterium]
MKLDLTDMLYALSYALDKVEAELLGVETGHGKRVAYLAILMGKEAGLGEEELRDFVGCCLLHDNALTEFIHGELYGLPTLNSISAALSDIVSMKKTKLEHDHSLTGEENIRLLPFLSDVKNIVLYHHENADGSGAFGMTASKTPLKAQILHLADLLDATRHIRPESITATEFEELCLWVQSRVGSIFSEEVAELFFKAVTYDKITYLSGKDLLSCLHEELHKETLDYSDEEIRNIAKLFAKIVDYKSESTQYHSRSVAEKAEIMARFYGFDREKTIRFYFAGAMHDIGKLVIANDILEKPGKLTAGEFAEMKYHPDVTYYILSQIKEIPDILSWASNHHEKLNGNGYPQGLKAEELSFEDQLMACIDIYQALTETRSYKDEFSHEKAISIMHDMVKKGEINEKIVQDIDTVMANLTD